MSNWDWDKGMQELVVGLVIAFAPLMALLFAWIVKQLLELTKEVSKLKAKHDGQDVSLSDIKADIHELAVVIRENSERGIALTLQNADKMADLGTRIARLEQAASV